MLAQEKVWNWLKPNWSWKLGEVDLHFWMNSFSFTALGGLERGEIQIRFKNYGYSVLALSDPGDELLSRLLTYLHCRITALAFHHCCLPLQPVRCQGEYCLLTSAVKLLRHIRALGCTATFKLPKKHHHFVRAYLQGSINAVSRHFTIFNVFILAMPQMQRTTNLLIPQIVE